MRESGFDAASALPSLCNATANTCRALLPLSKPLSSVPSARRRARPLCGEFTSPPWLRNAPPARTVPSGWKSKASTSPMKRLPFGE